MNRALKKEMRAVREGIFKEKDPTSKQLMIAMYRDMYGQAFKDDEAKRPSELMRRFVRSSLIYLILAVAALSVLGHYYGMVIVYVGGVLILGVIVALAVLSMRTTNTISEAGMQQVLTSVFTTLKENGNLISTLPTVTTSQNSESSPALPPVINGELALNADSQSDENETT
jgi:hypothetical protein